jgi:uncharacterized membrane protein YphA (DoxX/SURF4 family)
VRTPYDGIGIALQRLFSTFPGSWPGFGLLLLRCSLGAALAYSGAAGLSENASGLVTLALCAVTAGAGIFLIGGLWTPMLGTLVALDEFRIALWIHSPEREHAWIHIFLAVVALSVAMLGPGAWSLDARLFGRKRIDLSSRGRRPSL